MEKMDEMEKEIDVKAYMYGYKVLVVCLGVWSAIEASKYWFNFGEMNLLPIFILNSALYVQELSKMFMIKKMVEGDEEYKQPKSLSNTIKVVCAIIWSVLSIAVILKLINDYIFLKF